MSGAPHVDEAVRRVLEHARDHHLAAVTAQEATLLGLAEAFAGRPLAALTPRALRAFCEGRGITPESSAPSLRSEEDDWESRYAAREGGAGELLPWESPEPTAALVDYFRRRERRPRRVLELGCGEGRNAIFMAEQGCDVTALDVSTTALGRARAAARARGVELRLLQRNVLLPAPLGGGFDLVFDRGCFHHVPVLFYDNYREVVADLLRPGGELLLICHSPKLFAERHADLFLGAFSKLVKFLCDGVSECGFSRREVADIFAPSFDVVECEIVGDDLGREFEFLATRMLRRGDGLPAPAGQGATTSTPPAE